MVTTVYLTWTLNYYEFFSIPCNDNLTICLFADSTGILWAPRLWNECNVVSISPDFHPCNFNFYNFQFSRCDMWVFLNIIKLWINQAFKFSFKSVEKSCLLSIAICSKIFFHGTLVFHSNQKLTFALIGHFKKYHNTLGFSSKSLQKRFIYFVLGPL